MDLQTFLWDTDCAGAGECGQSWKLLKAFPIDAANSAESGTETRV